LGDAVGLGFVVEVVVILEVGLGAAGVGAWAKANEANEAQVATATAVVRRFLKDTGTIPSGSLLGGGSHAYPPATPTAFHRCQ